MAPVFLSYRRTDSPQACRVYDWLALRLGEDALFMDVRAIPLAVAYPSFIKDAIRASRVVVVLIGAGWVERVHAADDPVRMEVETAIETNVPVLPVLIGSARMPDVAQLPASLSGLAAQNAASVGVLHDFDTHMRMLWPRLEALLGGTLSHSPLTADAGIISTVLEVVATWLSQAVPLGRAGSTFEWRVFGSHDFANRPQSTVSLYLHRLVVRGDGLELHLLLSIWAPFSAGSIGLAHEVVGHLVRHAERNPLVPETLFPEVLAPVPPRVKLRRSDEDPRLVWKMVTDQPLQLSMAYVATVSSADPTGVMPT